MGDIQDDESPMVIRYEQHMANHGLAEEDDVNNMYGEPSREGQLEVHIKPIMMKDERPLLRSVVHEK